MIHIPQRNKANDDFKITKNGDIYILPVPWSIEDAGNISFKTKLDSRGYSHGSTVTGDRKIEGRTINIKIHVKGNTAEEHDLLLNEILSKFMQRDYTIICGRADRSYNVDSISKFKSSFIRGFKQHFSEATFTLNLADTFRYAVQLSNREFVFDEAVESHEVSITNTGNIDTPLIITLTPSVTMADVQITHVQSDTFMRLRDTLLTNPATLTVDTKNGTVRRGTNNAINAMSGLFLTALPGTNTYKITSAAGKISFSYTERWAI